MAATSAQLPKPNPVGRVSVLSVLFLPVTLLFTGLLLVFVGVLCVSYYGYHILSWPVVEPLRRRAFRRLRDDYERAGRLLSVADATDLAVRGEGTFIVDWNARGDACVWWTEAHIEDPTRQMEVRHPPSAKVEEAKLAFARTCEGHLSLESGGARLVDVRRGLDFTCAFPHEVQDRMVRPWLFLLDEADDSESAPGSKC